MEHRPMIYEEVKITGFWVKTLFDYLSKSRAQWFESKLGYMASEVMKDNTFSSSQTFRDLIVFFMN
jgi:hypothetical protein